MNKSVIVFLAFILFGCANQITLENDFEGRIVAIPYSPGKFTGWIKNHCDGEAFIPSEELNCAQIGGEVYLVKLRSVHLKTNKGVQVDLKSVLKYGGGESWLNLKYWCFDIVSAPRALVEATGVEFLVESYERDCKA